METKVKSSIRRKYATGGSLAYQDFDSINNQNRAVAQGVAGIGAGVAGAAVGLPPNVTAPIAAASVNPAIDFYKDHLADSKIGRWTPMLFGAAGMGVKMIGDKEIAEQKKAYGEYTDAQNEFLNDAYYSKMKMGGKIPKKLDLKNGKFKELGKGVYEIKGASHSQGGVKADTNKDGQIDAEVEGGEIYLPDHDYILSKATSKKYKNLLMQGQGIEAAIKENEALNSTPNDRHFAGGGDPWAMYYQTNIDPSKELAITPLMQDNVNQMVSLFNPTSINKPVSEKTFGKDIDPDTFMDAYYKIAKGSPAAPVKVGAAGEHKGVELSFPNQAAYDDALAKRKAMTPKESDYTDFVLKDVEGVKAGELDTLAPIKNPEAFKVSDVDIINGTELKVNNSKLPPRNVIYGDIENQVEKIKAEQAANADKRFNLKNINISENDINAVTPYVDNVANAIISMNRPNIPKPVDFVAPKIETKVNVNPQLAALKRSELDARRSVVNNVSHSGVAASHVGRLRADSVDRVNTILGNKENTERGLRNEQRVLNADAQNKNNMQESERRFKEWMNTTEMNAELSANISEAVQNRMSQTSEKNMAERDRQSLELLVKTYPQAGEYVKELFGSKIWEEIKNSI